ncbi:zinc ribbon domain-containing protein [Streptomyces sp. NPDC050788]|uniref:zinc ribbon domain-containing protein n=1 Tax=Streptomyces sp. NPDC050788 TaxID=3155041 RepID=UPI00343262CA
MTDNCPRCGATTEPQDPADEPQRYICRSCGHSWTTSRNESVWAPPADAYAIYDDPDAWEANDPQPEPWWADQDHQPPQPPGDRDLIAEILARENKITYTVERLDQEPS